MANLLLCKAYGFRLGKFICNNTMVLKSLQEDHRRKGVEDGDLSSGELPVESTWSSMEHR